MTDIPHPAETAEPPRGFAPAVRERHHARVAVEGPKGSGKSRLAMQWAQYLAGDNPVAAIDTEHRRLAAFAPSPDEEVDDDPFRPPWDFWHHPWSGPFDPVVLVRRAEAAAEVVGPDGVVVIDSLTPFWSGRGGIQDIVDGSPSGWKVGAPVHRDMLESLSRLPCHLIVTMRSKTEYVIEETDIGGRLVHVARRIGGAPDQRLGIDFEFEVIVTLDPAHRLSVTASSCPPELTITSIEPGYSGEVAQAYAAWISDGIARISRHDVNLILDQFARVMDTADRAKLKNDFIAEFDLPDEILAADAPTAIAWVTDRVDAWLAPPEIRPTISEPTASPEQPPLPTIELHAYEEAGGQTPGECRICGNVAAAELHEEPVPDEGDGLAGQDKPALIAIAETMGVAIDRRWSAARLAEAIREAMSADITADGVTSEPDETQRTAETTDTAAAGDAADQGEEALAGSDQAAPDDPA